MGRPAPGARRTLARAGAASVGGPARRSRPRRPTFRRPVRRRPTTAGRRSRATGWPTTTAIATGPTAPAPRALSPYLRFGDDPPAPAARPPRPVPGPPGLRRRAGLAGVLRRRAASTTPHSAWRDLDRRMEAMAVDTGAAARRRFDALAGGPHRLPARRRRDAPAPGHRMGAQPGPDGRGELPGQGPPPSVAVGCPSLPAPPGRRRPGLEQPRLAVDGRDGHRRRAVLPGLQPGHPVAALRPGRRLHPPLGARARPRGGGWTCTPVAVQAGRAAGLRGADGRPREPSARSRSAATS